MHHTLRRRTVSLTPVLTLGFAAFSFVLCARVAGANDEFFEKRVRPLLVQHCHECHSADSKKLGGGLRLDSRAGWKKGGDTGPALIPQKVDESLLISAIRYTDESLRMPPKGKLSADAIATFEEWVKLGAPDPREETPAVRLPESWEETLRERRDWWSLKPVVKPAVPMVKDEKWSDNPVDRFLLAKLESQGLSPATNADPRTIARRLSLVLTGLPPTNEELAVFLKDVHELRGSMVNPRPDAASDTAPIPPAALTRFVDHLLGSVHFGERWARHWMDVVRFTETHGNEWNYEVHHAWRYRDYLIRAFNADVPYDQFVREQIAGDLLPNPRWNTAERFNESVIGTAFYRFGEANHDDCIALRQIGYDLNDNQIDTLTKAFQATTVACARCHDHKLDPISMRDYYGMLGMLRSSRYVSHTLDTPDVNTDTVERLRTLKSEIRGELAELWKQDSGAVPNYLLAAWAKRAKLADAEQRAVGLNVARLDAWVAALPAEPLPLENPLEPWRLLADERNLDPQAFAVAWGTLAERFEKEDRARHEFNTTNFALLADFRHNPATLWQHDGQGLRSGPSVSGELRVASEGDNAITSILPAGWFTHVDSDRLNGALRSPVLTPTNKKISLHVLGQRSSAVRLVSSMCQLNYRNYRALTSDQPHWVTFDIPEDSLSLRTYAELVTMFDNPKFPDQLSALGGDGGNYRLPWEKAAENPRSCFGVTHVVVHDVAETPKPGVDHLRALFAGQVPADLAELANRYAGRIAQAVEVWSEGSGTDEDSLWLDTLVRRGLLRMKTTDSPRLAELTAEYRRLESTLAIPRVSPGIGDAGAGYAQPVFTRGESYRPGEAVPRRYLEVLGSDASQYGPEGSGRLRLADEIASPTNPLTARVMVNRVWHHLFGAGLVRTVDDFGHVGELPSHPELLDYLAARFIEEGWSTKVLIRHIVSSRAFQLAHEPGIGVKELDPQNRLLQHYPARRLEAEGIRDAILAVSGRLDRTPFGYSVQPFRASENADRRLFPGPLDGNGRRSVYIKNNLMEAPEFLEAFNFPGGKITQGRRDVTNVPGQALALLNDPFVIGQAEFWGKRLIERPDASIADRIDAMFEQAVNRPPTPAQRQRFVAAANQLAELNGVDGSAALRSLEVWKDVAHAMFNLREFVYVP